MARQKAAEVRSTALNLTDKFEIPLLSIAIQHEISSVHEYIKDGKTMNLLHISVSLKNRNPNWDEMCFVKEKLLGDEMPAVQFHPPRSEYVNEHEHCLHIWASEDFSELWRRMGEKDYWRAK